MTLDQILNELRASRGRDDAIVKLLEEIARLDGDRQANLKAIRQRLAKVSAAAGREGQALPVSASDWLQSYFQELSKTQEQAQRRYGVELEEALKPLGITLSGVYPRLQAGLFTLSLDTKQDRVTIWYGPEHEKLAEGPILAADTKGRIEQALKSIGSKLEIDPFVAKLRAAYRRAAGDAAGKPAPIMAVLPEMAFQLQSPAFMQDPRRENYRSYGRADFSYDLFRLGRPSVSRGLKLTVAVRNYTQRRTDFLWIPDNEHGRGTPYSHIHFEEPAP